MEYVLYSAIAILPIFLTGCATVDEQTPPAQNSALDLQVFNSDSAVFNIVGTDPTSTYNQTTTPGSSREIVLGVGNYTIDSAGSINGPFAFTIMDNSRAQVNYDANTGEFSI